jgi:hypothetical protein
MELWQMDVVGRVYLADGLEVKVVTGIDDHSRFVVCAKVVARATARPVCQALSEALARHGVPTQILTDNGRVFTARFGTGPGPVMFDRICTDNGIKHLLTAPYSPTATGKVERLHKTMRAEFFTPNDRMSATIPGLQAALDAWVAEYNTARPPQSCGRRPPAERFRLAQAFLAADGPVAAQSAPAAVLAPPQARRLAGVSRWVNAREDFPGRVHLQRRRQRNSVAGVTIRAARSWRGNSGPARRAPPGLPIQASAWAAGGAARRPRAAAPATRGPSTPRIGRATRSTR